GPGRPGRIPPPPYGLTGPSRPATGLIGDSRATHLPEPRGPPNELYRPRPAHLSLPGRRARRDGARVPRAPRGGLPRLPGATVARGGISGRPPPQRAAPDPGPRAGGSSRHAPRRDPPGEPPGADAVLGTLGRPGDRGRDGERHLPVRASRAPRAAP